MYEKNHWKFWTSSGRRGGTSDSAHNVLEMYRGAVTGWVIRRGWKGRIEDIQPGVGGKGSLQHVNHFNANPQYLLVKYSWGFIFSYRKIDWYRLVVQFNATADSQIKSIITCALSSDNFTLYTVYVCPFRLLIDKTNRSTTTYMCIFGCVATCETRLAAPSFSQRTCASVAG